MTFIRKTLLLQLACILGLVAYGQTPAVSYRSTAHYRQRTTLFHHLPMITSDNTVMLGNSLTEFGGNWNLRIPKASGLIINRGIMGDDAYGMLQRLSQITPAKPKKIFVGCGINDVSHRLSNKEVAARVKRLLGEIHRQSPESQIYYFSLLPINESFGRWKSLNGRTDDIPVINREMEEWCRKNDIVYIDVFSHMTEPGSNVLRKELSVDGLHLTEEGYSVWVDAIKQYF